MIKHRLVLIQTDVDHLRVIGEALADGFQDGILARPAALEQHPPVVKRRLLDVTALDLMRDDGEKLMTFFRRANISTSTPIGSHWRKR